MADVLGPSIVLITLALISYTTGVWAERWRGTLAWWHIGAFGVGLLCDASGSFLMARMAQSGTVSAEMNPLLTSIMTVTGTLALGLMAVHLVWAIVTMVRGSECAARETGIDAEIIDLRSLWPLDLDTVIASVKKTGRCVVVHEATRTSGFGAELVALVQEHCFYQLEAPIERVTGWDTPYPHAQEWAYFPGPTRVGEALQRAVEG